MNNHQRIALCHHHSYRYHDTFNNHLRLSFSQNIQRISYLTHHCINHHHHARLASERLAWTSQSFPLRLMRRRYSGMGGFYWRLSQPFTSWSHQIILGSKSQCAKDKSVCIHLVNSNSCRCCCSLAHVWQQSVESNPKMMMVIRSIFDINMFKCLDLIGYQQI